MKIAEIAELACGTILTDACRAEVDPQGAFVGDLMSDVLASIKPEAILITGLNNPQVLRTALISDVCVVIIARGKKPSEEMTELAKSERIPLISSPLGLFELSAKLAAKGIVSYEMGFDLSKCV